MQLWLIHLRPFSDLRGGPRVVEPQSCCTILIGCGSKSKPTQVSFLGIDGDCYHPNYYSLFSRCFGCPLRCIRGFGRF